jgi:hypothetical protein
VNAPAPLFEPLTIPLVKHLDCGHDRTDHTAAKPGVSMHCHSCRTLADVTGISLPRGVRLTRFNHDRLADAGYSRAELKALQGGR